MSNNIAQSILDNLAKRKFGVARKNLNAVKPTVLPPRVKNTDLFGQEIPTAEQAFNQSNSNDTITGSGTGELL